MSDRRPHMAGRPGELGWAAVLAELQRRNPQVVYRLSDARAVSEVNDDTVLNSTPAASDQDRRDLAA